jgi:glycine oxidase
LKAVGLALKEGGVECRWGAAFEDDNLPDAGIVVDCRGMGAKGDLRNLRGVRGEIVRL